LGEERFRKIFKRTVEACLKVNRHGMVKRSSDPYLNIELLKDQQMTGAINVEAI
jgi:hypothetical protein